MTERRTASAPVADDPARGESRGFRPASRRRTRIAVGVALAAIAIGGNALLYAALDDRTEVVQVRRDVRAGELVTRDDLVIVEVDVDPTVPVVLADDIGLVVDRYARTYLASGSLMVANVVQDSPLVSDGTAVVAVEVRPTQVPSGLRERSRVELVVRDGDGAGEPFVTQGRVVARGDDPGSAGAVYALSVEVPEVDAARVVRADDIGIVLLDPGEDPATASGAGG